MAAKDYFINLAVVFITMAFLLFGCATVSRIQETSNQQIQPSFIKDGKPLINAKLGEVNVSNFYEATTKKMYGGNRGSFSQNIMTNIQIEYLKNLKNYLKIPNIFNDSKDEIINVVATLKYFSDDMRKMTATIKYEFQTKYDEAILAKEITSYGKSSSWVPSFYPQAYRTFNKNIELLARIIKDELPKKWNEYVEKRELALKRIAAIVKTDRYFKITSKKAVIRFFPNADSKEITKFSQGERIQVTGLLPSGWLQVSREGKPIGWIHKSLVKEEYSTVSNSLKTAKVYDKSSVPTQMTLVGKGQHWAVIIGLSEYRDSRIPSLRYANRDAEAFYNWLISPQGGRYALSRVRLLLDKDASYRNIKNSLFVWLKQALAEDVVTIYFAGHGSPASPDSPDNLFLLPYDTQYDDIPTTGFPMWDIETALKRFIKAKKVVVIADACHSGGVGQSFDIARRSTRGLKVNPISSAIQNLSNIGDGICVISASADKQFSQEGQQWDGGHGVFTYFLLQGLEGEADYNKDNIVSLGELVPFLSQQVRRATRNAQSPNVAGKFDPALSIGK